ncbi:MAG: glutathione peroxidase [Methylibium sp.]|uniref:glutathione peroxidase n=1 Tax=Methylibium sp. TaxID=2067992 RepID=UPI00184D61BF|nr:glutathione peroxidase [Methylibium sp.]MBA3596674.1 glutathione peroxidase [Methylibium sp.]
MTKTNFYLGRPSIRLIGDFRGAARSIALVLCLGTAGAGQAAPACGPLLDHSFPRLQDEKPQHLCQYAGKVVLLVNTASFCGFTSQYQGLEALNDRFRSRGLVVLGFPTNDFGDQEPGSNGDIAAFCENTFGVQFPMFAKTTVKGSAANPLIRELARRTGQTPVWNFHKYVIGRDGRTVKSYASRVDPQDRVLVQEIERLLEAKAD